jgi:nucleoside-diphosphate-sugar epimerase
VTGASGWFGLTALARLHEAGLLPRTRAYASTAKTLTLRDGTEIEARPLSELEPADWLLHFAYLTRDRGGEGSYLRTNLAITLKVLDALSQAEALVYLSSGAAGWPSDLDANGYGALKRLDELAFRQACADAGARSAIFRVFAAGGPYMAKWWGYALGDLIMRATRGEPLQVRAKHPVYRSYVAASDVVDVALAWLRSGERDVMVETAGPEVVEVGELAERIRAITGRADLEIVRDFDPALPRDHYVGDGGAFKALAARLGIELAPLDAVIAATARDAEYWPAQPLN